MKTLVTFAALLLIAGTALAGRFNVIRYECDEFEQKQELIRCAVPLNEGQPWLLIRVLPAASSAKHKKRALYLIDRTIFKFQAMGGRFFTMRSVTKEGGVIERACSPGKGRRFGMACHDWHPLNGPDVFKWP